MRSPAEKTVRVSLAAILTDSIFQIRLNPNPRRLMRSLEDDGLQYPVHLQIRGGRHRIIDGHQRIAAARALGWEEIVAVLHEVDDREALRLAYKLNEEHQHLTPLERLNVIEMFAERGLTNAEIAPVVGLKHENSVARLRGSLKLSRKYWALLREQKLRPAHVLALKRAPQKSWDRYVGLVIEKELSARELARAIRPKRRDLLDQAPDGWMLAGYRHSSARTDSPEEVERHAEILDRCADQLRVWARRRRKELAREERT